MTEPVIVIGAGSPEPIDSDRVAHLRRYLVGIADIVYSDPVDMPDLQQARLVLGRMFDHFERWCRASGAPDLEFPGEAGD